jgi:serine/threonine protein phosphatase PrpC
LHIRCTTNRSRADPLSGLCDVQGRRRYLEDHFAVAYTHTYSLWGVYDGHLGASAAQLAAHHLPSALGRHLAELIMASSFSSSSALSSSLSSSSSTSSSSSSSAESRLRDAYEFGVRAAFAETDQAIVRAMQRMHHGEGDDNDDDDDARGGRGGGEGGLEGGAGTNGSSSSRGASSGGGSNNPELAPGGTTATVALLTHSGTLVVANVGDSRAVLCCAGEGGTGEAAKATPTNDGEMAARRPRPRRPRNGAGAGAGRALELSRDHTANDPAEAARIEALGGWIDQSHASQAHAGATAAAASSSSSSSSTTSTARVNGMLAVSRSLGDAPLKPFLTAEPHIATVLSIHGTDDDAPSFQFLIVATDGLWDVIGSDEAVAYVQVRRSNGEDWQSIALALTHEALLRGSLDNIGVCVIDLQNRPRTHAH